MGDYGIKVMKEGYSINDTDIRNILLSSKYNMLKYHIDTTGNLTVTAGNTSGSINFAHSLGYIPIFLAYVQHSWVESVERELPFGRSPQPLIETAYADSTNVTCRVNMTAQPADKTFVFRVIIFKDKIL